MTQPQTGASAGAEAVGLASPPLAAPTVPSPAPSPAPSEGAAAGGAASVAGSPFRIAVRARIEAPAPTAEAESPLEGEGTLDLDLNVLEDTHLLAWWWNSHQHLSTNTRLEIARRTLEHCTNAECAALLRAVIEDMEQFVRPMSVADSISANLKALAIEHPWFTGCTFLGIAILLIKAGAALSNLVGLLFSAAPK